MSFYSFFSLHIIKSIFLSKSQLVQKLFLFFLSLTFLLISSCGPSKKFTEKKDRDEKIETVENVDKKDLTAEESGFAEIRVLINGIIPKESLLIESPVSLYNRDNKIALIKPGNIINCYQKKSDIEITIKNESFASDKFILASAENDDIVKINGKRYRGKVQISSSGNSLDIINLVNMEDYVKGVLAKEMPVGKNEENLEALKALAVCVRTYAQKKLNDGKIYFDIYDDTRDQVYGGLDAESPLSNKAAEETKNLILKYNGTQATLFYHSTCGGYTESSQNVFTKEYVPYLKSIKDGSEPYCKISPRYEWTETYSKELIISRLKNYSLIDDLNYHLEDISILSRFNSGRVNEMEIKVVSNNGEKKNIIIRGNEIRNILRTSDGKMILWGTMFEISKKSNSIVLSGKGFGHGVGLCQWGAIALSQKGWSYKDILEHYFPGCELSRAND